MDDTLSAWNIVKEPLNGLMFNPRSLAPLESTFRCVEGVFSSVRAEVRF